MQLSQLACGLRCRQCGRCSAEAHLARPCPVKHGQQQRATSFAQAAGAAACVFCCSSRVAASCSLLYSIILPPCTRTPYLLFDSLPFNPFPLSLPTFMYAPPPVSMH